VLLVTVALALAVLVALYAVEAHSAPVLTPKESLVGFLVWTIENPGWLFTSMLIVVAAILVGMWMGRR